MEPKRTARTRDFRFPGLLSLALLAASCASPEGGPAPARNGTPRSGTTLASARQTPPKPEVIDMPSLQERLDRFAPFTLRFDDSRLTAGERAAMEELVRAGDLVDRIFLEQMGPETHAIFERLRADFEADPSPENRAALEYFWLNKSPFDVSSDDAPNEPFLAGPGVPARFDPTRGFYPEGTSVADFDAFVDGLSAEGQALAKSDFSLVRKAGGGSGSRTNGGLEVVPYSEAYAEWTEPLAASLERAAGHVPGTTLAKFLEARAEALRTNDYEKSEGLWIGMNGERDEASGSLDVTIGPYENYLDELLKRKAAFQFYLTVLRPEKTEAMQLFREHVHSMDEYLFELFRRYYGDERTLRWSPPGDDVTLVAVDVAYATGMGNQSYQTLGYNLPNVAEWQEKYGTKKVMLMNVLDGKFERILRPIADVVLAEGDRGDVVADMFTDNTVRHEVAHGIGPSTIFVPLAEGESDTNAVRMKDAAGNEVLARRVDVRDRMGRYYSAFEEAKAEIVSLLFGYWLEDKGLVDETYTRQMATTYVASTFRTIRFGATSDHAKGKIFEFNRLVAYGAVESDGSVFRIRHDAFRPAVERLAMDILGIQVFGDVEAAGYLLRTDGHARRDVTDALDSIAATDIPVDLRVRYTVGRNYSVTESKP